MTATIGTSALALETVLDAVDGMRATRYLPDVINPPHAVITPQQIDYHKAFRGGDSPIGFVVTLFVGRVVERTAQDTLYAAMSPTGTGSFKAAVEADQTLGGVVQSLVVVSAQNINSVEIGGATYLAVDFIVTVHP